MSPGLPSFASLIAAQRLIGPAVPFGELTLTSVGFEADGVTIAERRISLEPDRTVRRADAEQRDVVRPVRPAPVEGEPARVVEPAHYHFNSTGLLALTCQQSHAGQ